MAWGGIVFGQDESHLYIATANGSKALHQESPGAYNIYLRSAPETAMQADLLASLGGEPSTIILRVNKQKYQPQLQEICLRFDRLSDMESVQRGTRVYAAGSVASLPWAVPVLPDAVIRVTDNEIVFQTAFVGPGHTGGALLDEQGHVLGMIQSRSGPLGFATRIDTIINQLRVQEYPISLRKSKYGPDNPLLEASQVWDVEEVKKLIDECHDVNARDMDGNVPLHFAVRNGSAEIVTQLLERSAKPNVENEGCGIPLTKAVARNI